MKKWFFLLALFVVPAALFSAPHLALAGTCGGSTPCNCGDTVTSDYTLSDNLTCSLGANGLIVGSGVVLNGAGHSITGSTDVMPVIYNNRQYTYPTGKGSGVNAGSGSTIEGFSNITGFFMGYRSRQMG